MSREIMLVPERIYASGEPRKIELPTAKHGDLDFRLLAQGRINKPVSTRF
jgi:hypothetical protein